MTDRAGPNRRDKTGVLFVCLGNICRSPLAEGIFIELARERGVLDRFEIDSCGTGSWHVGECADPRSAEVARRHGVELHSIGRQFDARRDPQRFDWIIAMDRSNQRNLLAQGVPESQVRLMRSFDPELAEASGSDLDVPDPYHWPGDGFEEVYKMLHAACEGMLEFLLEQERRGVTE